MLSAAIAGATRAALLAFILPVTVPATAADILPRLVGWGIAVLLTVPAAILVWPPGDHNKLRDRASEACAALAGGLSVGGLSVGGLSVGGLSVGGLSAGGLSGIDAGRDGAPRCSWSRSPRSHTVSGSFSARCRYCEPPR